MGEMNARKCMVCGAVTFKGAACSEGKAFDCSRQMHLVVLIADSQAVSSRALPISAVSPADCSPSPAPQQCPLAHPCGARLSGLQSWSRPASEDEGGMDTDSSSRVHDCVSGAAVSCAPCSLQPLAQGWSDTTYAALYQCFMNIQPGSSDNSRVTAPPGTACGHCCAFRIVPDGRATRRKKHGILLSLTSGRRMRAPLRS